MNHTAAPTPFLRHHSGKRIITLECMYAQHRSQNLSIQVSQVRVAYCPWHSVQYFLRSRWLKSAVKWLMKNDLAWYRRQLVCRPGAADRSTPCMVMITKTIHVLHGTYNMRNRFG